MAERVTKQIGAPEDLIYKLKRHALDERKDLHEVFEEAILDFFEQREEIKKSEHRRPDYFVSPTDAKDFNVRVSKNIAAKIDKAADEDAATGRRLVYTGLVNFVRKNKL